MEIARGFSKNDDSVLAGQRAAKQIAKTVPDPDLVIVFASPEHSTEDMLTAVSSELSGPEIIGCSTGGELYDDTVSTGSVVILALKDEQMTVRIGVGTPISENNREAGRQAALEAMRNSDADNTNISHTVFSTALTGNASDVMRGVQEILGDQAHVTGGLAGDGWKLDKTYIFHGEKVLTDSVLIATIEGNITIGHGVRHGLKRTGNEYTVTKSDKNIVYELDNRSVSDVYTELFGDRASTAQFLMTKPLGIELPGEEPRLRDPLVIQDDGSIVFAAELKEGSVVEVMESPVDSVIDAARTATRDAVKDAGNPDADKIKGVILYDCVCRWQCLDNDTNRKKELAVVREVIGEDVPIIGWYTYGEIALPRALAGVHNQTLVVQLFVENE